MVKLTCCQLSLTNNERLANRAYRRPYTTAAAAVTATATAAASGTRSTFPGFVHR